MAREFKEMWFGGAGEFSEKKMQRLHKLLDEGLEHLSGIQQPPHSESEAAAKEAVRQNRKCERRIKEIAADLYCALTGKEP